MTFSQKLQRAISTSESVLCVGLDPDPQKIPEPIRERYQKPADQVFEFCRRVIEATKLHAAAYKPNLAFFEAIGPEGIEVFEKLLDEIPPGKIIIADAKRGDIGTTAQKYKEAFFDFYRVDALTLNPLMGMETLEPFLNDEKRALFVLTMTSNPGAADFLKQHYSDGLALSTAIASKLSKLQSSSKTHLGMVVGATDQDAAVPVLSSHRNAHLLIPGVGAQGGDIESLTRLLEQHGGVPIISSSRAIIYAGENHEQWEESVQKTAFQYQQALKPITDRLLN